MIPFTHILLKSYSVLLEWGCNIFYHFVLQEPSQGYHDWDPVGHSMLLRYKYSLLDRHVKGNVVGVNRCGCCRWTLTIFPSIHLCLFACLSVSLSLSLTLSLSLFFLLSPPPPSPFHPLFKQCTFHAFLFFKD